MAGSRTVNMTEGSPIRLLTTFAFPLLIGNLFQQAYNLADSMIVGQLLGSGALAAVGSTGSLTFLFFSVCNGVASGAGVVTAQLFGAGEFLRTKRAIANAAYIMLSAGLMMATLFLPQVVMNVPQFLLFTKMGWVDSYLPLVVPAFFACDTYFVFMMCQFMRSVPKEMEEAAEILEVH